MQLHAGRRLAPLQQQQQRHHAVVCSSRLVPRPLAAAALRARAGAAAAAAAEAAGSGDSARAPDRVVCLGEALFDFLASDADKGVPRERVKQWTPYPGGAPANVATCLAKLGVPTAFVSALGTDERGDELVQLLKDCGVDTATVQRVDAPTRDVYVERTLGGDRVFAGFGQPSDAYCDCRLDAAKLPLDVLTSADLLVTGTLGLAAPATAAAMRAAVAAVKAGGGKLFVDVNWRPVFWPDPQAAKGPILEFLGLADVVKISDADLEYLYDMPFVTALLNPCAVADKLPNAAAVLVTAGEEGSAYCCRSTKGEHTGFVPVFRDLKVVDTTGAGDAFTAGFILKLLEAGGLERLLANPRALKEAVVFAAATGGLTCTKPGAIAGQPTLEEVRALFEQSEGWYNFWGAAAEGEAAAAAAPASKAA